jgi:hypothetical protein
METISNAKHLRIYDEYALGLKPENLLQNIGPYKLEELSLKAIIQIGGLRFLDPKSAIETEINWTICLLIDVLYYYHDIRWDSTTLYHPNPDFHVNETVINRILFIIHEIVRTQLKHPKQIVKQINLLLKLGHQIGIY